MRICVFGLWHLGSVTAACLSKAGFDVIGLEFDQEIINKLQVGKAPIYEPGLDELINEGLQKGNLNFTDDAQSALAETDLIWVAFDTPVDEDDQADVEFVARSIESVMGFLQDGTRVLISSQVPVGFTRRMEETFSERYSDRQVTFAYSPENLQLGKAIKAFQNPGRIVAGIRRPEERADFETLLLQLCEKLEWMSTESAEMTKHAINAFLATSVVFANEVAVLCEKVGADASEVERGLKSEERIGPRAYLRPGAAFAGGTLARDITILGQIGKQYEQPGYLFKAIKDSNDFHKAWAKRKILECLGTVEGKKIGVLGLTYKPGTDTLRRSGAIELCRWLLAEGATIRAFDPVVKELPEDLVGGVTLGEAVEVAFEMVDCVVVATEWPQFRKLPLNIINLMGNKIIVDASGFLERNFSNDIGLRYMTVGK